MVKNSQLIFLEKFGIMLSHLKKCDEFVGGFVWRLPTSHKSKVLSGVEWNDLFQTVGGNENFQKLLNLNLNQLAV